jgi:stage IV sporulation protein A
LKELQKPFLVILNSTQPNTKEARELAARLEGEYDIPVLPVNCAELSQEDIYAILQEVLYEFPVKEVNITLPKWVEELDGKHWLRTKFEDAINEVVQYVRRLRDIDRAIDELNSYDFVEEVILHDMDLGSGLAVIEMTARGELFYQILEEITGVDLEGEHTLLRLMKDYVVAKNEWDKVAGGIEQVRATGYGIVSPSLDEMILEEPEVIRQGARFGVRLRAIAPSIHLIRTDVKAEISPIIGTEKQSEEFITYMMSEFEGDAQKIWRSQIFGKSLNDLVRESIAGKLHAMPENAQQKMQETLTKIVNEGNGGLICIIF